MLKINLLPSYVYERRKIRTAVFGFGVLFAALIVVMIVWWAVLGAKERQLTVQVNDMEQKANEVRALEQQVQAEQARIPIIQAKVAFIEGLMAYNLKLPVLYEELAKYTYSRIMYRSVQPSASGITIKAYARTVGDCGRYLLNMYRASHIFSSVAIDAVPGWPAGGGGAAGPGQVGPTSLVSAVGVGLPGGVGQGAPPDQGFEFTVTCTLAQPIQAPMYGAGAGAPGAAGAGMMGAPGMGPGAAPMPSMGAQTPPSEPAAPAPSGGRKLRPGGAEGLEE